eukprot:gnl/TRDRNA2_/TRDRNA2_177353_c3_seq1.p1 gnl/TRDRNA2_/TRDRNA2_177353_c3~~gnl/TRDRNA2_/TRDRNA2_177353_c3_seq1.p1  ORF type:complete len:411 (+),score=99.18 gnl/TRDRNA2_/TRDRNA2_177353_c3_seq1:153-1385(+)
MAGIAMHLAQRWHHLLAIRICEWVGQSKDRVLFHWACEKIRHAKNSARTDDQICEAILEKFRGNPGIGYAEVALVAAEMYRPHLATMLLSHEPRGHSQVQVLLQLSRNGDDDNRMMMLRIAFAAAAESRDPDLLYAAISASVGGDIYAADADLKTLVKLLREKPAELQVVGDFFYALLEQKEMYKRARTFYEDLGKDRLAAQCAVQQVFQKSAASERQQALGHAQGFFSQVENGASEALKLFMQFGAQACLEEIELLKLQVGLEEKAVMKRWMHAPHKFVGLSLVDTLRKLIELQEIQEADNLKKTLKIAETRYWRIKVRALSDFNNLQELHMMATNVTSPIGYEFIIEAFLKHDRNDYALSFISQVSSEQQAVYYERMGMDREAEAARAAGDERGGAGRLLSNMLNFRR